VSPLSLRHSIPTLGCALLMGALALLTVLGEDGLVHRHLRVRAVDAFQREIQRLDEDNFRLRLRIQRLRDRPLELERSAASVLLMARPDALLYHFPQEEEPRDETAPTAEAEGAGRRSP